MEKVNIVLKKVDIDFFEQNWNQLLLKVYPARREKVMKLRNKKAAVMSLAAGIEIQKIITSKFHVLPEDIRIFYNENGKPVFACEDEFHFNLSHSGDMLAIVYGNTVCGIDVERTDQFNLKISKRCFTKSEDEYVNGISNKSVIGKSDGFGINRRFTTIWTMKEAYLKYKGTGISVPLNSFTVNPYEKTVEGEKVKFFTKEAGDYVLSVCVGKYVTIMHDLS